MLKRCLEMDGTDGRTYVGLGKLYRSQERYDKARHIYEEGSMATGAPCPLRSERSGSQYGHMQLTRGLPCRRPEPLHLASMGNIGGPSGQLWKG